MKITPQCVVALTGAEDTLGEVLGELDEPIEFFFLLGGDDLLTNVRKTTRPSADW
jgi:hypothetical protein